jgi:uncharacterized protein (DUF433 family)
MMSRASIGKAMTADQINLLNDAIWVNPRRMSGAPCFRGTRVPVWSLIELLKTGETIDYFLTLYPSVTRRRVLAV